MDYTDDEIRKLLEEATPGPWVSAWDDESGDPDGPLIAASGRAVVIGVAWNDEPRTVCNEPNARLIAAAPTLARLLLSARADHRQAVDDIYTVLDDRDHYRDEATRLAAELAAVREALDAAGAPLTVERGGSGPDSGDEVEATTADRVRWLALELDAADDEIATAVDAAIARGEMRGLADVLAGVVAPADEAEATTADRAWWLDGGSERNAVASAVERVLAGDASELLGAFAWARTPHGLNHWRLRFCGSAPLTDDDRAYLRSLLPGGGE